MKAIIHKDWLNLKNEMTIRMSHHTIDMSFLLRFYSYVEEGHPVWQYEEKREIILKEQEKTKIWEEYSKKLENRSCDTCKHIRITQFRDYEKVTCTNENCNEMFDCDVGSDFYCNKWENKQ